MENSNLPQRLASKVYPVGSKNEVQAQIARARGNKVATSEQVVSNVIKGKRPMVRY